ncbi:VOC family protein [Leifsonia flava]|uniref:Catechol 1,2-dioxygenase n=1 Tax=Orlajensenia leifsoniae TaxID=2561933 RepID=A0A4Y9R857_9MICO|nr:VOC family protein [Leifsonia flava]TFV99853.1 catechol 1,2-dioxygenase [Leifsonia flava]
MIKLLSHLSHVEITTPDVAASVAFYEEQVGLRTIHTEDGKHYLRAWGDYYTHSLVISEGPETTLAVMAWRTSSDDALDEAVRRIEAAGHAGTWTEKSFGHGRSYTFTGPYGHTMELYWDVEKYKGEGEFASVYPDRPERRSRHAVAPRQLDHVTVASSDVKGFAQWYGDVLGFRAMAFTELDEAPLTVFGVITTNEKSHDLGIVYDGSSRAGRVNHYAYWVDTREELLQAADVLMENGTDMEYGPSIHGIGEQSFLYFRDPSGMRVEVNTGGYRNYVPDWEPYDWKPSQGSNNFYRNGSMPMSMTESFPPADGPSATEEGVHPDTLADIINPYAKQGRG